MFTTLAHLIDEDFLREAYRRTSKSSAAGIDGVTAKQYAAHLEENLRDLHERLRSGRYQAAPVERVWIEKDDGGQRPIGKLAFEDKIVQRAVAMLLEAIYEQDFHDGSYGFRQGRSPHDALRALREQCMTEGIGWIVDADVSGYFDSIDRARLRDILRKRVNDGRILRLIGKWLRAGVMEEGVLSYPESGVVQGGVISPPTKLPTCFVGIGIAGVGIAPKHNIDLVLGDFDPLDQRPDEVALARPGSHLQPVVQFGGKVLPPANNERPFPLPGGLLCQRVALLLQSSKALAQAGDPGRKLGCVNEALRITVDQPGHALPQRTDLGFDSGQRRTSGARLGLQAAPICLCQALRVGPQGTDFLPHRQVQQVGPHLLL